LTAGGIFCYFTSFNQAAVSWRGNPPEPRRRSG